MNYLALLALALGVVSATPSQTCYNFRNVRIGGGGGFVPGLIFNPTQKGLAYARTDIGGAYRLNPKDHTWIPLQDNGVGSSNWGDWYIDSLATDPVQPSRVYMFAGAYTNSWDPNNSSILASNDYGNTWKKTPLPFKTGGNSPGRGIGERLAIDPNKNNILFLGTRSGNGLWKSSDYGRTWNRVESFTNVGTFIPDPNDASGYNADNVGVGWVVFDKSSGRRSSATKRIFAGVADKTGPSIFVSEDAGATWNPIPNQPVGLISHRAVLSPKENVMYITYTDGAGPYDGADGYLQKYNLTDGTWTDISPTKGSYGYGGVSIDAQQPGTLMVAALNMWWPDTQIYRSKDSGKTWTATWEWASYPDLTKYYNFDVSSAPWLHDPTLGDEFYKLVGWMIESLEIDPHDSNHFLYGTGATIFGSRDLTKWDTQRNFTLESLATGVEETAILGLASPKEGPSLISAVGDITGFTHLDLNRAPQKSFSHPSWATSSSVDYAGNNPSIVVRTGEGGNSKQLAVSTDSGITWREHPGAPAGRVGGKASISADGKTIIWTGNPTLASVEDGTFENVGLPSYAILAADRVAPSTFYAAGPNNSILISNTTSFPEFATASTTPPTGTIRFISTNPYTAGDVWVATSEGIFRSKDYGKTFSKASTLESANKVAVGGSKKRGAEPVVFATGVVKGQEGVFRSENGGKKWNRINGKRGFGALDSIVLTADPRKYGRVYLGTNGRGIFYGDAC